jgi:ribosomal protein S18 acetylase RimI-like enzyme
VNAPPSPTQLNAIEHATLAAVGVQTTEEAHGWLLPFDTGTIGRAKSAVPLWHAQTNADTLNAIAERYRAQGLPVAFRVGDLPHFEALRSTLRTQGYTPERPTWVQTVSTRQLASHAQRACVRAEASATGSTSIPVDLALTPDAAWAALFLGEGFDPVDGASRVQSLSRAMGSLYASVRENSQALAAGAASFSHGWVSVHGMRTAQSHRSRGLASSILRAVATEALARGIDQCFLQVEAHNTAAQSVYRGLGFETVWGYSYWI